jgi:hypothetical protein
VGGGFGFSNKVCKKNPRQFRILFVRASQPTWQGYWTTPVSQTFTHASQIKTPRRPYIGKYGSEE